MPVLVLTVLADDRPGLVSALSTVLADHQASWERSQLAELAGKFAGIVEVRVPATQTDGLLAALDELKKQGWRITVERIDDESPHEPEGARWTLEIVGADRPGLVVEISALLAEHGVSFEQLDTWVSHAPMAGGHLFNAVATLVAPADADTDDLRTALEALAHELMVEVELAADPLTDSRAD